MEKMKMTKRKNSVGYFSAYYRGLECLLDMCGPSGRYPREQVPDATLDVYYGWESRGWDSKERTTFYVRMNKLFELLKDHGVTVHGRVSHEELAKAMNETQVWAYPTEFTEIHCITALKAQEAGCYPVVTNVGALAETVQSGVKLKTQRIYTDEYQQDKFVEAVVNALKNDLTGTPIPGVDWSDIASKWDAVIKEKQNASH
jgi:glycosyltransferase involved in cell wall biosynthesis